MMNVRAYGRYLLAVIAGSLFFGCSHTPKAEETVVVAPCELNPEDFVGELDGNEIALYTLKSETGMEVSITNYGGRVVSLWVPDKDGNMGDVVCGFDNVKNYMEIKQNLGAAMGRYIGRITGAQFDLDGQTYKLDAGGDKHIIHGGSPGFANRVWSVVESDNTHLVLQYVSPDGENGFPGELTVNLTYSLTADNGLKIDYSATTTAPTVVNMANHSFFNLSGDMSKEIVDQKLWVAADSISEIDAEKLSTGKMLSVENTPFDFREAKLIGRDMKAENEQLAFGGNGYDHCFQLVEPSLEKPVACLSDEGTGRVMEVYTTQPGIQVYTANSHNGSLIGKHGIPYNQYNSICLETTHFPNSPNVPAFPSTVLRPGETFTAVTVYKFSTLGD
ncbi:MAG: aldose epimerase family protein [Bacteroidales bacterium]|nr:aldose epimerase family protein [Bacteroidales bacterium]